MRRPLRKTKGGNRSVTHVRNNRLLASRESSGILDRDINTIGVRGLNLLPNTQNRDPSGPNEDLRAVFGSQDEGLDHNVAVLNSSRFGTREGLFHIVQIFNPAYATRAAEASIGLENQWKTTQTF